MDISRDSEHLPMNRNIEASVSSKCFNMERNNLLDCQTKPCHRKSYQKNFYSKTIRNFFVFGVFVAIVSVTHGSSVNDCRGVREVFRVKGLDPKDVPRQPRQGSQLQICPRGLTCCTEDMEKNLWANSREKFVKDVRSSANPMVRMFGNRAKRFDENFTDLLIKSKLRFHRLFQKTYGVIYERNSDVFIDFFKDLEAYYEEGKVDLEDALQDFFSRLYQRMFTVFNAQHKFDTTYLSCVSQTMKKLQPFGDVPKQLTEQLRRSFVAARTFAQALIEGKQILNKILKVAPRSECVSALTKMLECPACQAITSNPPCSGYCQNVMKGCLAYHLEMDESWDKFVENLQLLADRLIGPFDIESVVVPIGLKISDAIMNFQSSGYEVTAKVFQDCGTPRLHKRQANYNPYDNWQPSNRGHTRSSSDDETRLKVLVHEIRESLGTARNFWTKLPQELCKNINKQPSLVCWNGLESGVYSKMVVGDTLRDQERNPEMKIDISRPDIYINEQIFALKLITKKLETAQKGQNVEWPESTSSYMADTSEGSGEGCGINSDDEDCYNNFYNNNNEEGSGSGDGNDIYVTSVDRNKNSGQGYSGSEDTEDEEGDNWPPWVISKPDVNKDIVVDDSDSSKKNSAKEKSGAAPSARLARALLYYMVPVLTCFIGSAVPW